MDALTLVHVAAGAIGLTTGAVALAARKGSALHLRAGSLFFTSMLLMAGTGALVAALRPERGTAAIGLVTAYLIVTAWAAARRRDGRAGTIERIGLAFAVALAALMLGMGVQASASATGRLDSLPAAAHYPFAALMALAASLDLSFILRGRLSGAQRLARHVWRMCAALLIAALSFFSGQQDEFPEAWQGAMIWNLPGLLIFATMLFWLVRIRYAKALRRGTTRVGRLLAAEPAQEKP